MLVLSASLYIGTAGTPALDDEDVDAAHAMVSQEMLQRHNFVVMYMDGIRYLIRPPMHFWMVAASYKLLGESEFATRLPIGLAVVGMVLLTFEFGNRFFGQRAGLYGALALATSVGMFIFTRSMIPEAIYALAFEGIFYLFLRSWTGSLDPRLGYWGAAALCAVAVLTRALIGLLFPAAAIVAFITMTRGWHRWRELRLFSSSAIFLAIAAPWHILAAWRTPGFFWAYFINEHINRALGTRLPHDYGALPLWIWWSAHLAWLFPWSFFLPLALRELPLSPRAWAKPMDPEPASAFASVCLGGCHPPFLYVRKRLAHRILQFRCVAGDVHAAGTWHSARRGNRPGMAKTHPASPGWGFRGAGGGCRVLSLGVHAYSCGE